MPNSDLTIGVVARRTGVSPQLIRAWERRYGAVRPERSDTRRRLYSDRDVSRLRLLKQAIDSGRRIGDVASLDDDELRSLVRGAPRTPPRDPRTSTGRHAERCLDAIRDLDGDALRSRLERAAVDVGRTVVLDDVLSPLMTQIGDLCRSGDLRTVHEHLATSVVRGFLDGLHPAYPASATTPRVLVTTPARQHHEIGALLVAAAARSHGWRVTYPGPNLPAEEIAAAARQLDVALIALSVTYPTDDSELAVEIERLGRMLPEGTAVVAGGRAAPSYRNALERIGGRVISGLPGLRDVLDELRVDPSIHAPHPSTRSLLAARRLALRPVPGPPPL